MTNKKLIIFILAFVLMIGFWFSKDLLKESDQPLFSPQPSGTQLLKIKLIEIKEVGDKYEIQINYPEFFGSVFPEAEKTANLFLKNRFEDDIKRLKDDLVENIVDTPGLKSSIETNYEEIMLTDKLASIRFDNSQYGAGAAHPNSFYSVFNYDFEKNEQIELVDLFSPGSDFLPIISDLALQDIKEQLKGVALTSIVDEEIFKAGLEPNINNFSDFNFDEEKITFVFDPYQFKAYPISPQLVSISYDQLREFNDKSELLKLIEQY